MRLTTEFTFDAAHRIPGHAGKRAHLRLERVMISESPTCRSELTRDER